MMILAKFACWRKGVHDPRRIPSGGFRCILCGATGVDMEAMGFRDGGYIDPTARRMFSRSPDALVRTSDWSEKADR